MEIVGILILLEQFFLKRMIRTWKCDLAVSVYSKAKNRTIRRTLKCITELTCGSMGVKLAIKRTKCHLGCYMSMFPNQEDGLQSAEERDIDLVEQAYQYLTAKSYPTGATENRKEAIRNKARKFLKWLYLTRTGNLTISWIKN